MSLPHFSKPIPESARATWILNKVDYDVDVLIIGGGGAGASAAIEADNERR